MPFLLKERFVSCFKFSGSMEVYRIPVAFIAQFLHPLQALVAREQFKSIVSGVDNVFSASFRAISFRIPFSLEIAITSTKLPLLLKFLKRCLIAPSLHRSPIN